MKLTPHLPRLSGKPAIRLLLLVVAYVALTGCSSRKNTAANRQYQAFITRYNIYYNGDTHYTETLEAMENGYPDDFSQLLFVHPSHARGAEGAVPPSGDFTRSIEKAQKAIQLRSIRKRPRRTPGSAMTAERRAWLNREEYNPFIHNAWLMLGRSQFMNGDFLGASSTFLYISKHFQWLPDVVTEARIWLARSYCCMGWIFEAESAIDRIDPSQLKSKQTRLVYALTSADIDIRKHDYKAAVPPVELAASLSRGVSKARLRYLAGQLNRETGNLTAAREAFGKVARSNTIPYSTKISARLAMAEVASPAERSKEIDALRRMIRYERNGEYLGGIYTAMGNLRLLQGDTAGAVTDYREAILRSRSDGFDKARAGLALGNLSFARRDYPAAQTYYAEAIPMLPENYPGLDSLRRRSDILDRLADYVRSVELQDSLLRLAAMPEAGRRAAVDRIIGRIKERSRQEADSMARRKYLDNFNPETTLTDPGVSPVMNIQADGQKGAWYFYNKSTVEAGRAEFRRRWGNRRLEDDWRRHNKSRFSLAGGGDDEPAESQQYTDSVKTKQTSDPLDPEYYLAQIPLTPVQKHQAEETIIDGLYNIAQILHNELEDIPAAISAYDSLLKRYPDNIYRQDAYNNIYMIYMRTRQPELADNYRRLIVKEFPDTPLGKAMAADDYSDRLCRAAETEERRYDEIYTAYLENRNDSVHNYYREFSDSYSMSRLMPKFMFVDALAYVTENNPEMFRQRLSELVARYPESDVSPLAAGYIKGIDRGRKLSADGRNPVAMVWNMPLTADSITVVADSVSPGFSSDPESEQLLVLVFPVDSVSANDLLYRVARHNFSSFVVRDFELEQLTFGRLGLLVISGFDNISQINHYRKVMARSGEFTLPEGVRPVVISRADFDVMLAGGYSFDDYFRWQSENPSVIKESEP